MKWIRYENFKFARLSLSQNIFHVCDSSAAISFRDFKRLVERLTRDTVDIFIPQRLSARTSFEGTMGSDKGWWGGEAEGEKGGISLSWNGFRIRIRSGTTAISKPVAHSRHPIRKRSEIEVGSRVEAIYVISMEGRKDLPEELWRLFAYAHEGSILIELPQM